MGIRGLFTHVQTNKAYEIIDLVSEAKKDNGIEILVDFNAYQRDLIEFLSRRISLEYDNIYLLFPGGEFDILHNAFYDLQKAFEAVNINLVWIIDGPKGVDEVASEQKKETWIKRDKQDIMQCETVLSGCSSKTAPTDLNNLGPLCSFEVTMGALKEAGAEIIHLLQGESDEFIAYEFHRRKSFAIITNDTDFLIFRDCKVIFPRLMNACYSKKDYKMPFVDNENPGKIFKRPDSFNCPVVTQKHTLDLFQLQTYDQLVVLSILKGNDNTNEFAQKLQYKLRIIADPMKNPHITHVANYIKKYSLTMDNILNLPQIKDFMTQCPEICTSINYCSEFYSLKRIEENVQQSLVVYDETMTDNSLTNYFAKKLSTLELYKGVYSLHFGASNDSINIENPSPTCAPINTILNGINIKVYPYILHENRNEILEWRSRGNPRHVKIPVQHSIVKTNQISAFSEENDSTVCGVNLFENIWSHLEPNGSLNYFKKFGFECGFLCYLLRYFYQITKNKNLNVSPEQFRALFITVFYHFAKWQGIKFNTTMGRETFLRMKICPSAKCLIINVWFLRIFFSAKYLCGGAFNLTTEFPSIQNIINASVLYAFYEDVMNETNQRISHLDNLLQESIQSLGAQVMQHYDSQYCAVTQ